MYMLYDNTSGFIVNMLICVNNEVGIVIYSLEWDGE